MDIETKTVHSNRLIVLLPDCLANHAELARKIYWMAQHDQREVIYLTMVDDAADIPLVGCHMETMKSLTATNSLNVQSTLTETTRWLRALQAIYCPGDQVVCQQEQVVRNGLLGMLPVGAFLQNEFDISVTNLSGFYHPVKVQISQWLRDLIAWLGFLTILAFFTRFEIQLNPLVSGQLIGKILLCIIAVVEIALIWFWNTVTKK